MLNFKYHVYVHEIAKFEYKIKQFSNFNNFVETQIKWK